MKKQTHRIFLMHWFWSLCAILAFSFSAAAAEKNTTHNTAWTLQDITFENIFPASSSSSTRPPLEGQLPKDVKLSSDGRYAFMLQPQGDKPEILELRVLDTQQTNPNWKKLIDADDILNGAAQTMSEAERMRLERLRRSEQGITDYRLCGDLPLVLVSLSGDVYGIEIPQHDQKGAIHQLTRTPNDVELDVKCDSHGEQLAFVIDGSVYTQDIRNIRRGRLPPPRLLAKRIQETESYGLAEFVAQEEMDRMDGYWWSPDGTHMLVMQVDESVVPVKKRSMIFAQHTEVMEQRYPLAGGPNARVTAWLFDVKTKKKWRIAGSWYDPLQPCARSQSVCPPSDGYLPRAGFFDDNTPYVVWQSRDQKTMYVLHHTRDAMQKNRTPKVLLTEKDNAWVNIYEGPHDLGDGTFLWESDRSGTHQLERVNKTSGQRYKISHFDESISGVLHTHQSNVWVGRYDQRGQHHCVTKIDLKTGNTEDLTSCVKGWSEMILAGDGSTRLVTQSSLWSPPQMTMHHPGLPQGQLHLGATSSLKPQIFATLKWSFWSVPTNNTQEPMNALVLFAPQNKRKNATIYHVYGGPTGQLIADRWFKRMLNMVAWANMGYDVILVDTRGTGHRNRDWERMHYKQVGTIEVEDTFASVAESVKQFPQLKNNKAFFFGWSYGGFLATRVMLDEKTPFVAAVAVAPVIDWRGYDTHYTERYLGNPLIDDSLYKNTDLTLRAALLQKPLFLVHGTADDNVLFEQTLSMVGALQKNRKAFELMIYPGNGHGIGGRDNQAHLYQAITDFFMNN
jgi:dipeptidyl-peptidase-4